MADWIEKPAEYDHNKSLHENKQRSRGVVECRCGTGVNLRAAMQRPFYAAECPACGQLFNLSGQELRPVEEWED